MALFTDHPFRNVIKGILAMAMGHLIMKIMPHSIRKYHFAFGEVIHLTQTSVAVLAIGALILLVVKQHRNTEGRVLSQSQEELILIAALGAFWLAFLLAMRAYNQGSIDIDLAHPRQMFQPSTGAGQSNVIGAGSRGAAAGAQAYMPPAVPSERFQGAASYSRQSYKPQAGFRKPYPCNPNDAYCVVEEWTFY